MGATPVSLLWRVLSCLGECPKENFEKGKISISGHMIQGKTLFVVRVVVPRQRQTWFRHSTFETSLLGGPTRLKGHYKFVGRGLLLPFLLALSPLCPEGQGRGRRSEGSDRGFEVSRVWHDPRGVTINMGPDRRVLRLKVLSRRGRERDSFGVRTLTGWDREAWRIQVWSRTGNKDRPEILVIEGDGLCGKT